MLLSKLCTPRRVPFRSNAGTLFMSSSSTPITSMHTHLAPVRATWHAFSGVVRASIACAGVKRARAGDDGSEAQKRPAPAAPASQIAAPRHRAAGVGGGGSAGAPAHRFAEASAGDDPRPCRVGGGFGDDPADSCVVVVSSSQGSEVEGGGTSDDDVVWGVDAFTATSAARGGGVAEPDGAGACMIEAGGGSARDAGIQRDARASAASTDVIDLT